MKLLTWRHGVVLVLFVVFSVLNVVAGEQDYYKVRALFRGWLRSKELSL